MTASSENSRVFAARLRHAVLGLLIHLCVCHCESAVNASTSRSKSSELYVRNALLYISDNYSRPITIESIASSLGITKYHLSREFKRYTGETLVTHINKLRCRKAQLLIIRGYSVTEAALECGFESGSYFSQICKRITGLSPSEFKNGSAKGGYSDTFIDDGIDS